MRQGPKFSNLKEKFLFPPIVVVMVVTIVQGREAAFGSALIHTEPGISSLADEHRSRMEVEKGGFPNLNGTTWRWVF